MTLPRWRDVPKSEAARFRAELRAIYAEVDALLAPFTCDASTACCRFGVTGREPYPTAVELAELLDAVAARGIAVRRAPASARPPKNKRRLPLASAAAAEDERRCPLLDDDGSKPMESDPPAGCRVYASRPFGCRTFFCDRVSGPGKLPRGPVQELSRRLAALSARAFPADPHARPLERALAEALGT